MRLIDQLSSGAGGSTAGPAFGGLVGQLMELRSARVQREMIARGGVSPAQWMALILLPMAALTLIVLAYNHDLQWQLTAASIYIVAVCAALFVILAHDRPFVGHLGIKPIPIERAMEQNPARLGLAESRVQWESRLGFAVSDAICINQSISKCTVRRLFERWFLIEGPDFFWVVLQLAHGCADLGFKIGLVGNCHAANSVSLEVFPDQFVWIAVGRIGRQKKQPQSAVLAVDKSSGLLGNVGGAAIDDQEDRALGAGHQALEELDEDCCIHPALFFDHEPHMAARGNRRDQAHAMARTCGFDDGGFAPLTPRAPGMMIGEGARTAIVRITTAQSWSRPAAV